MFEREYCTICGRRIRRYDRNARDIAGVINHVTMFDSYHIVYFDPVCGRWECNYFAGVMNEENFPMFASEVLIRSLEGEL
jgi:hypothetical protein